jgi:outer membrane receptor protein involved in Fe transport
MFQTKKFLLVTRFFAVLAVLAVVGGVARIQAQSIMDGKLTGIITDDKGEPLPGATVEIAGPALLSGKRSTMTSAKGTFVFLNVPLGRYKVSASMPSFKTVVQENIVVTAGSTETVRIVLPMGTLEETVVVTGTAPVVDVKTSSIDAKIDRELLDKLPTSRDSFYDLSLSTPGMFDVGKNVMGSPTAYGGSTQENIFLVNGVDTTNPRGAAWGSMINVNYDNVQEVRVISLGSKAEYGNFSGAAIDVITKSGTNKFQGSLAFYSQLGTPRAGAPNTGSLGRNWLFLEPGDDYRSYPHSNMEMALTVGGPFISKKLWFFAAGNFLNSKQKELNWDPLVKSVSRYADIKITGAPMKNHYAWLSYHFEHNNDSGGTDGSLNWDPSMAYNHDTYSQSLSSQWQWFPSSSTFLSVKFLGFLVNTKFDLPGGAPNHPGYINWWKAVPFDMGVGGAFEGWNKERTSRTTIQADVSHYAENFLGEHDIKFGVQYTRGRLNLTNGNFFGKELVNPDTGEDLGFFGYYNTAYPYRWTYVQQEMIDGYGDTGLIMYVTKNYSKPYLTARQADSLGFFFDDQWSPVNRLTLNLGLRYDAMTAKFGKGMMYEQPTTPQGFREALQSVRNRAGSSNLFDFTNWSPRVGLTYQLTDDQKTVLRASFGRYYTPLGVESFGSGGPDQDRTYSEQLFYLIPFDGLDQNGDGVLFGNDIAEATRRIWGTDPINSGDFATIFRSRDPSWGLRIHPGLKNQHTDQLTLSLEREIVKDFSVAMTFIHRNTTDMIVQWPLNKETQQPWEYERKTQVINGQSISLYSIVLKDYDGSGVIDGSDIQWIGDHSDFEWRNMPDMEGKKARRLFQGLQLTFTKRYSNRWQLMGSLLYNNSSGMAARNKRQDQDYNMEGMNIWSDAWLGGLNQTVNNMDGPLPYTPRFEFKISGNYTIPKVEVDIGLRFRLHTGRPAWVLSEVQAINQWNYDPADADLMAHGVILEASGGMPGQIVAQDPTKPLYLPVQKILDLRLEKTLRVGRGELHIMLDGFNILNTKDVTNAMVKRVEFAGILARDVGRVVGLVAPRYFRLGLLYQF